MNTYFCYVLLSYNTFFYLQMPNEISIIDTKKLSETTFNIDVKLESSGSQIVEDTTTLRSADNLQQEKRPSSEFVNTLEPESFDSLIVQSILKCDTRTEHKPKIVPTDIAGVSLTDTESHEVIKPVAEEDIKKLEKERLKKMSVKAHNVTSELNVAKVSFTHFT